jgi:hypothetical protein
MKKIRIRKDLSNPIKTYETSASSYWFDDIDTDFTYKVGHRKQVDYTKLAAAQRAIGNFVNIVTGKQIPVKFQNNEESWTDGKSVTIGSRIEDKNFDPAVGLALHEGSHIAFTNFKLLDGCYIGSSFHSHIAMRGGDPDMNMVESDIMKVKDLFNWIEDRRIDYHVYTNAPGYRKYYESMYAKYFDSKIVDKGLKSDEKTDEDWDSYMFRIINLTNPNRRLNALEVLPKVWKLIDLKNINRLKSSEDALNVAIEVYKVVSKQIKDTASKQQQTKSNKASQQTSKSDCGSSSSCSNPDSDSISGNINDGQTKTAPKQEELSDREHERLEKQINKQKDFIDGNPKKIGKLTKKDNAIVRSIKESGTESVFVNTGHYGGTIYNVDCIVIKKMTHAVMCHMDDIFDSYNLQKGKDPNSYYGPGSGIQEGILLGKQLGKKLQLRNEERSLKSTRLNAGKIDRRLISELGFQNASVFHRIVTDRYKNFFIHISIDASGSMGGRRFRNAMKSAVAIAQAASMTTGIRVQISLRGTSSLKGNMEKTVTVYAYDSAKDKMSKIKNYFPYLRTFGCTPEGLSFKSILPYIKQDAKGDECIFINYSDGAPSSVSGCAWGYNGISFTRKVVNEMKELGINVLSYFIDGKETGYSGDYFRRMYGDTAEFIDTCNLTQISKSMNKKFLELSKEI